MYNVHTMYTCNLSRCRNCVKLYERDLTCLDLLVLVFVGQILRIFLEDVQDLFSIVAVTQREEVSDLVFFLDQIQPVRDSWVVLVIKRERRMRIKIWAVRERRARVKT